MNYFQLKWKSWTYSLEAIYVLEYTPSKIDDPEIIKMAESAEPVE